MNFDIQVQKFIESFYMNMIFDCKAVCNFVLNKLNLPLPNLSDIGNAK